MKSAKIPKLVVYDDFVDKDEQIQFVETARNLLKSNHHSNVKVNNMKLNLNQFKVLQEHNSNQIHQKQCSNSNVRYLNLNSNLKKENQQGRSRTPNKNHKDIKTIRVMNNKSPNTKSVNTSINQIGKKSRSPSPINRIVQKVYNSDEIQYQECQQRIEKLKQLLSSNYKKLQHCQQKLIKDHCQNKIIRDQKKFNLDLLEKDNLEMQLKMYQNMYEVCIDNYIKQDEIKKQKIDQSQYLERLNQEYQQNQEKIEELEQNVQRHEVLIQPDIDKQKSILEESNTNLQNIKQKNDEVQNEIDRKQNIILMVHQDIQHFNAILKQKMDMINLKRNKIIAIQQQINQSQQAIAFKNQMQQEHNEQDYVRQGSSLRKQMTYDNYEQNEQQYIQE